MRVLVHLTKYLVKVGFAPDLAALALGLVGLAGIAGQIVGPAVRHDLRHPQQRLILGAASGSWLTGAI